MILDRVRFADGFRNTGCSLLYKEIMTRIQPLYHIFGHIWNNYGLKKLTSSDKTINFVNSCERKRYTSEFNDAYKFELPVRLINTTNLKTRNISSKKGRSEVVTKKIVVPVNDDPNKETYTDMTTRVKAEVIVRKE